MHAGNWLHTDLHWKSHSRIYDRFRVCKENLFLNTFLPKNNGLHRPTQAYQEEQYEQQSNAWNEFI